MPKGVEHMALLLSSAKATVVPKSEMPKGVEHSLCVGQRSSGAGCRSQRCRKALSTTTSVALAPATCWVPKSEMPKGVEHKVVRAYDFGGLLCRSQRCRKALSTSRSGWGATRPSVPKSEMPKGVEHTG